MKIKDIVRFFYAKIFLKKTVLFSSKEDWEREIRNEISGYVAFFYEFDEVNPNHFDIIVALTVHAQMYVNAHRELFAQRICLCPSDHCIALCDDKEKFHNYLSKNGFQKLLPLINKKFDYPYVLKKRVGEWGDGISIIKTLKMEMEHRKEIESASYFTQQYIKGKNEYTAHIITVDKKIVFFKALKFTFQDEFFIKGRNFNPIAIEKVEHGNYKLIFEKILSTMNYEGICCFNYKVTDGGLYIFEVNPRFGASLNPFINEALVSYCAHGTPDKR